MNTTDLEKLILLQASGELGFFGRRKLARLLAYHPEAAAVQQCMDAILRPKNSQDIPPTPVNTMATILGEARQLKAERTSASEPAHFPSLGKWKFATGFAATLVALGAVFLLFHEEKPMASASTGPADSVVSLASDDLAWESDFEERVTQISGLVEVSSQDYSEATLDELATALLELEGNSI